MYYLYRHIRLDTNQPFYVGVGTYQDRPGLSRTKFARAYSKNRKQYWKNVASKSKIEVEILFLSHDKEFICAKEKEFIGLYGRKEDGGMLVNHSLGGEMSGLGVKPPKNELERRSMFFKKYWQENRNPRSKYVYQYDPQGKLLATHDSVRKAGASTGICYRSINRFLLGNSKSPTCRGYFFSYLPLSKVEVVEKSSAEKPLREIGSRAIKYKNIYQYDLQGRYIGEWNYIRDIVNSHPNYKSCNISNNLRGTTKSAYGFRWSLEPPK